MEWGVKKVWIETATRYNILCTVIIQKLSHHNNIIIAALHRNSFRWIENRGLVRCVSNSSLPLSRVCFCQCDIRDFDHRWPLWSRKRCTSRFSLTLSENETLKLQLGVRWSRLKVINHTCLSMHSWTLTASIMGESDNQTMAQFGTWCRSVANDDGEVPRSPAWGNLKHLLFNHRQSSIKIGETRGAVHTHR